MKNNIFFLDLTTLDKKGDEKLSEFAKNEDLDVKEMIKIIFNEAKRIGETNSVKVNFKIADSSEDSFRVIVEPANVKYKGTVIYPFNSIKSNDFEIKLDSICGKITLYNKKKNMKALTVTIDYVGTDLFSMTYKKAKELLKDISDRKIKNGYIDTPNYICFKQYGVKINATLDDNRNALENEPINSIDVYNKEEFFKEFWFEEDIVQQKEAVETPKTDNDDAEKIKEEKQKILDKKINDKLKELKVKRNIKLVDKD